MEGFDVKEIEAIHEVYSLNINKLMTGFKENPEKYQVFACKNKNQTQTIMVSEKGEEVLFMELSDSFVTISDIKSGLEYRINSSSNQVIEVDGEKIKEYEIYETYESSKECRVDIILGINEKNEITCTAFGGELTWPINDGKDIMNALFGVKQEVRDEEIEDDDSEFIDDQELDTEAVEKELELASQENFEYDEQEDNDDELYELEDKEKELEEDDDVILFDFWKNGEKYQDIADDEFDEIVSYTKDIVNQIVNDFQIRMEELTLLRKGIGNILRLYTKAQRDESK